MHAVRHRATVATCLACTLLAATTSAAVASACPVTTPGGPPPPAYALLNFGQPMGKPSDAGWYGNGVLWTRLPFPTQFWRDTKTGLLTTKVAWFRARTGQVHLTATPRQAGRARFAASVGSPASYGPSGFAPSLLGFGHPGCWELRASLHGRALRLVVDVRAAPRPR